MSPSVGRIVHFRAYASAEPQAAIITRVWGPDCVNLTVLPDCAPPFSASSVNHVEKGYGGQTWEWPERVS